MAVDTQTLHDLIQTAIPDADIRIDDLRGDGEHYAVHVTSGSFQGKLRVAQHRMVMDAVYKNKDIELHALAVHTYVPETH